MEWNDVDGDGAVSSRLAVTSAFASMTALMRLCMGDPLSFAQLALWSPVVTGLSLNLPLKLTHVVWGSLPLNLPSDDSMRRPSNCGSSPVLGPWFSFLWHSSQVPK